MPEQLYCNGKVIFLYNALSPPAKQVVFCFGHLHFSEHEKLQCPQLAKAITKSRALQSPALENFPVKKYFRYCSNVSVLKTFEYFYILFFSFTGKATKTVENRINNIPIPSFNVIFSLKTIHPITTPVNGSNVLSSDAITAPHKKVPF